MSVAAVAGDHSVEIGASSFLKAFFSTVFGVLEALNQKKADIAITQQPGALVQMPAGARLADVVKALNALGATPQDLLAILQAMRAAGALRAEIEVI